MSTQLYLSIHSSSYPPTDPSIHPSTYLLPIHSSTSTPYPILLFIHSFTHSFIHPSTHLHLPAHPCTHPCTNPSSHLPTYPIICPFIHLKRAGCVHFPESNLLHSRVLVGNNTISKASENEGNCLLFPITPKSTVHKT